MEYTGSRLTRVSVSCCSMLPANDNDEPKNRRSGAAGNPSSSYLLVCQPVLVVPVMRMP